MFLQVVSPVFASQFFGPVSEVEQEICLGRVTFAAARAFVDFIYDTHFSLADLELEDLVDLQNLGEKYQMEELVGQVEAEIEKGLEMQMSSACEEELIDQDFSDDENAIKFEYRP